MLCSFGFFQVLKRCVHENPKSTPTVTIALVANNTQGRQNPSNPVEGGSRNGGGDGDIDGYGIPMKIEMQNMSDIGVEENAAYGTVRYGL